MGKELLGGLQKMQQIQHDLCNLLKNPTLTRIRSPNCAPKRYFLIGGVFIIIIVLLRPDQRAEQGNIAELSPGAVGAGGGAGGGAKAEHQAAINSMMMERMSTDISALKKQYARIKRRQQQQAMQLYIRTGD